MSLTALLETITEKAIHSDALGSTLKFKMEEGVIYLDGTGEENVVSDEDKDAACVIEIKKTDLENLIGGTLNPMAAFMGGKLKVKGDMGVAMKLQNIVS